MAALWGLDCANPRCRHDLVLGYRLHLRILWSGWCERCTSSALVYPMPPREVPFKPKETDWVHCGGCAREWRVQTFVTERPDFIFKGAEIDLVSAQLQARHYGAHVDLKPGMFVEIERRTAPHLKHAFLPEGALARRIILRREPLPRVAVYFRWQPEAGAAVDENLAFQCAFWPGSSAAERRTAPERRLTDEELSEILQINYGDIPDGHTVSYSKVKCQHCHQPLPLKIFSTLTLRQVEKGD